MGIRHLSNRRRSYARRQHEMHERWERRDNVLGWIEVPEYVRGPRPLITRQTGIDLPASHAEVDC
jgi:hypothetical protein